MKALTLGQPWAHAVVALSKRIENRTWCPPASLLGQRFAIHAGLRWDRTAGTDAGRAPWPAGQDALMACYDEPRGHVLGVATLRGFLDARGEQLEPRGYDADDVMAALSAFKSPWWLGPVGWLLGDVVRLAEPVPCRGAQGLWVLPADVEDAVVGQCRAASDGKDGEG